MMTFMFMKELLDPTFQAGFSDTSGYNPCRNSTYENEDYQDLLKQNKITSVAAKVAKELTDANKFYTSPAFKGSSDAREQVGNALYFAMKGEKTPETALADAFANCGGKK